MARFRILLAAALVASSLVACSDDGGNISCSDDELYDQVNQECVPRGALTDSDADTTDAGPTSDAQVDAATDAAPDAAQPDVAPDVDDSPDAPSADAGDDSDAIDMAECDKDRDNAIAESCGGYDCDDNDPARSPHYSEFCDNVDNNCSGTVNDNVVCTFFAHTGEDLYEVDPFAKTATKLDGNLPFLQDIDTHPDGTLFGITRDGLYRFDRWADAWVQQGSFGMDVGDPNGLAIDSTGTAFMTSQDKIYSVDLMSGRATLVGTTGNFYSSGDCVVNKRDTLFMTSKEEGQADTLVQVSRQSGRGTAVGKIGFEKIYALTAAWGSLYGLNSNGELILINQRTGEGSLVHTFSGISFWGAASTPNR